MAQTPSPAPNPKGCNWQQGCVNHKCMENYAKEKNAVHIASLAVNLNPSDIQVKYNRQNYQMTDWNAPRTKKLRQTESDERKDKPRKDDV